MACRIWAILLIPAHLRPKAMAVMVNPLVMGAQQSNGQNNNGNGEHTSDAPTMTPEQVAQTY